ncbi:MAG: hypothetical protein WA210_18550 [Burkholderiaceae bacterium]
MLKPHCVLIRSSAVVLALALLSGCASKTVLVRVAPQMDMSAFQTTGIVEFESNADAAINQHATRRFQESVQGAQPGTRFIELGTREHVLAAVGASDLDAEAVRKIGRKYGVAALVLGEITYSEPKVDIKLVDPVKLQGSAKAEIKGDIASRLMETNTGASVWSSSAWAKRQLGSVRVSADLGVSGRVAQSNPRHEMVADMVYHLTTDFRPTSIRKRVE